MIQVNDYKEFRLGDKAGKQIVFYEVHEDIGDALNSQRHRYDIMQQNLRVYGITKDNKMVVISNKLPKHF